MHHLICMFALTIVITVGVDGQCSVPSTGCQRYHLISSLNGTFTSACEFQGLCYDCGARYGVTKKMCDDDYKTKLASACTNSIEKTCIWYARANFAWGRLARFGTYVKLPKPYCSESKVQSCFP